MGKIEVKSALDSKVLFEKESPSSLLGGSLHPDEVPPPKRKTGQCETH